MRQHHDDPHMKAMRIRAAIRHYEVRIRHFAGYMNAYEDEDTKAKYKREIIRCQTHLERCKERLKEIKKLF